MSIPKFFLLSLAFSVVAIGLQLAAQGVFIRGVRRSVRAVVALTDLKQPPMQAEADPYFIQTTLLIIIGFAFALASIGFVAMSARRNEPKWRWVTFALLFVYVMLQIFMI